LISVISHVTHILQLTTLWILIASAVITGQMRHLYTQLANTPRGGFQTTDFPTDDYETYAFVPHSVHIGAAVLGLTWAAFVAMLLKLGIWVLLERKGTEENKNARLLQKGSYGDEGKKSEDTVVV